jgi:hypothetical protein
MGSRGELEMVVEGVRRWWFQRWEGTDIVGELGKSMGRVGLVAKSREVVVEGQSVLAGNLRSQCLWWKEVVVEGIGSLCLGDWFDCHTTVVGVEVFRRRVQDSQVRLVLLRNDGLEIVGEGHKMLVLQVDLDPIVDTDYPIELVDSLAVVAAVVVHPKIKTVGGVVAYPMDCLVEEEAVEPDFPTVLLADTRPTGEEDMLWK